MEVRFWRGKRGSVRGLQTKLQTNHATQAGIWDHKGDIVSAKLADQNPRLATARYATASEFRTRKPLYGVTVPWVRIPPLRSYLALYKGLRVIYDPGPWTRAEVAHPFLRQPL